MVPLLFLGLVVFQLDRMNLGSALTGGFAEDIGIDQSTVNLGNQMMFLGIVVLEIPSNLLLQRVWDLPFPPFAQLSLRINIPASCSDRYRRLDLAFGWRCRFLFLGSSRRCKCSWSAGMDSSSLEPYWVSLRQDISPAPSTPFQPGSLNQNWPNAWLFYSLACLAVTPFRRCWELDS